MLRGKRGKFCARFRFPDTLRDAVAASNQGFMPASSKALFCLVKASELQPFEPGGLGRMSGTRRSVLHDRFEPGQSLIPLRGGEIEVLPDSVNGLGIEFEQALATLANAVHESCSLQHVKMLGDRLPRQPGALGSLRIGMGLAIAKFRQQPAHVFEEAPRGGYDSKA
jgi:hypothetical protein